MRTIMVMSKTNCISQYCATYVADNDKSKWLWYMQLLLLPPVVSINT